MNARHLIHGLIFAVAISTPVAAFAYRIEAQPQSAANPPARECKQVNQACTDDRKYEQDTQRQQQLSQQGPAERSARLLQQQRRVARLQWRL